jgi:zinc transport system substrate-binding protein
MCRSVFYFFIYVVFVVFSANFAAAGSEEHHQDHHAHIRIVSSMAPLKLLVDDLVGDLAGDYFDSELLVEGASTPHHHSLKFSEIKKTRDADLLIWLGADLEGYLAKAVDQYAKESVLDLSKVEALAWVERVAAHSDIHIWLSSEAAALMADAIAARLIELRPSAKKTIVSNLSRLKGVLFTVRDDVSKRLLGLQAKPLLAYHQAFSHFLHEQSLYQLQSVTRYPDEQLSLKRLRELAPRVSSAACILAEYGEEQPAVKLAERFGRKVVGVDILALNQSQMPSGQAYAGFYREIGERVRECLLLGAGMDQ